jgi:3-oxoacid CoA-transferase B subunit
MYRKQLMYLVTNLKDLLRIRIAQRAVQELKSGMYVNLGIGIPTLVANYVLADKDLDVQLHSENGMMGMGPYPNSKEECDVDLINAGKV